jgi:hypothetical protein
MENDHEISDEEFLARAEMQRRIYAAGALYQGIGRDAWMVLMHQEDPRRRNESHDSLSIGVEVSVG